jgi:hypothetical protein
VGGSTDKPVVNGRRVLQSPSFNMLGVPNGTLGAPFQHGCRQLAHFRSRTAFGTIASSGFMAGLRFDVRIRTAADAQFRTALTQDLQADAALALRGSSQHRLPPASSETI